MLGDEPTSPCPFQWRLAAWLQPQGQARVRVSAVPARVVDPTGAGDAFAGAFMAMLTLDMGANLAALLRNAADVGACAVEGIGTVLMEAANPGALDERRRRAGAGQ